MNEIAMFVGYVIISYAGLFAVLFLIYLALCVLFWKFESDTLEGLIMGLLV